MNEQAILANERMGLMLHNEGLALGAEIMRVIDMNPVLALFPSAFSLVGHPITIQAACCYVGQELHRQAMSN
jgi:hypothetical protein